MPPLSRQDLEDIVRFLDERRTEKRPAIPQSTRRGLVEEEIVPAHVRRQIAESQHEIQDRSNGFERLMLDSMALQAERQQATDAKVEALVRSIPPVAQAVAGAEAATVAGANASLAGATAAIDSKTNALAAKVASHRAIIVQVIAAVGLAIWQIYEHFAALPK